jgi:hypothetical protein
VPQYRRVSAAKDRRQAPAQSLKSKKKTKKKLISAARDKLSAEISNEFPDLERLFFCALVAEGLIVAEDLIHY